MTKQTLRPLAAIAGLSLAIGSANAATPLLSLDYGTGDLQTDFLAGVIGTKAYGDITVIATGTGYTRTSSGVTQNLTEDFLYGTVSLTLSGEGISANTDYEIKFWGYDAGNDVDFSFISTGTTTGTAGPIVNGVGADNPVTFDDYTATGTFTSNAAGELEIGVSGSNPTLNGFQLTAVPEPTTTALLGLGGIALILRRRK
jgi:hypothetical protein